MHRFLTLAFTTLLPLSSIGAHAASCVDIENTTESQSSQSTWTLKNTCDRPVDVSIMSDGRNRHVCTILHIDPGVSRTYRQEKVCHGGVNSLTNGCICETSFTAQERSSQ
jgi:hypothetical protein